jgi:hypothetical protein
VAAVITWAINYMNTTPTTANPSECVVQAGWYCGGEEVVNEQSYSASLYGQARFTYVSGAPFTPYDQLTQQQVLDWVWASGVNRAATEAKIQQQINDVINPPIIQPPLPWSNT